LNTNGVAFIAKEETGGLQYYEMVTRWPHYPGESSGITIGVGYDLLFPTEADFNEVWGKYLPAPYIEELLKDIGVKGSKSRAKDALQNNLINFRGWHMLSACQQHWIKLKHGTTCYPLL